MRDEPVEFWSIENLWNRGVEMFMGVDMGNGYARAEYEAKEWRCEKIGEQCFRTKAEACAEAEKRRLARIAAAELLILKLTSMSFAA